MKPLIKLSLIFIAVISLFIALKIKKSEQNAKPACVICATDDKAV